MFEQVRVVNVDGLTDEEAAVLIRKTDRMNRIKAYSKFALITIGTTAVVGGAVALGIKSVRATKTHEDEGKKIAKELEDSFNELAKNPWVSYDGEGWTLSKKFDVSIEDIITELRANPCELSLTVLDGGL